MEELDMSIRYSKQFKEDAVRYLQDHADAGLEGCSKNLGISKSALSVWAKEAKANNGEITTRGSGNYESDAAKENVKLRRELRDSQDALEILKKAISILGK
jgi:transposase